MGTELFPNVKSGFWIMKIPNKHRRTYRNFIEDGVLVIEIFVVQKKKLNHSKQKNVNKKILRQGHEEFFLVFFTWKQNKLVLHLHAGQEKGKILAFPDFQTNFPDFFKNCDFSRPGTLNSWLFLTADTL